MPDFHTRFPGHPRSVALAREQIRAFASPWFSDSDLYDVEITVGEAMANSIEHGEATQVELNCSFDGNVLVIDLQDDGRGFAPKVENGQQQPRSLNRGHGISIMRASMDTVEFSDRGRRLRLTKRSRNDKP